MMTDLIAIELIEEASEPRLDGGSRSREHGPAASCGAGATILIQPEEFRAELARGEAQATRDPYEEGFGAFLAGKGLPDNPYAGDNCAHLHWANGWSQARDEAQRQARQ
jgi:hypothetical protein